MADQSALRSVRQQLAVRWPGLIHALPQTLRPVRHGGAIGLSDQALVVRRSWLESADLPTLRAALLHLAAHQALGHRPWRRHPSALDRQMDAAAGQLLRDLGIEPELARWQGDHHGQWRETGSNEPGLGGQPPQSAAQDETADQPATASDHDDTQPPAEPGAQERTTPTTVAQDDIRPQRPGRAGATAGRDAPATRRQTGQPPDWRALLQVWLSRQAWRNWRFDRPARHPAEPFILPRLGGRQLNLVVALDISGSISNEWLDDFLAGIEQLQAHLPLTLRLLTCDNRIHSDQIGLRRHALDLSRGGGGTDFRPVFARLRGDASLDALLYCTDLVGEFPAQAPDVPVFWLTPATDRVPPFGTVLPMTTAP